MVVGSGDTTTNYTNGSTTPALAHALSSTTTTGTSATTTSTYSYNAAGQTQNRTVTGGTQAFSYTPDGFVNTVTQPSGTVSYVFDADGNQLVRHDPQRCRHGRARLGDRCPLLGQGLQRAGHVGLHERLQPLEELGVDLGRTHRGR